MPNHDMSFGPVMISDSATKFTTNPAGAVVVTASHGGRYPAHLVASLGVRAAVFNDAGIGRDQAGIAGLAYLEKLGIAAAAVSSSGSRIGYGQDTLRRGVISHANAQAQALGCLPGMACGRAVALLRHAALVHPALPPASETRRIVIRDAPLVVCIDSASLVRQEDAGAIVMTGSHGGLLGGRKITALKYDALAAVYNDAGMGCDNAGASRLPALDERGIAGATVAAASARIGEGLSTYEDGVLSAVNATAERYGGRVGMTAKAFAECLRQSAVTRG